MFRGHAPDPGTLLCHGPLCGVIPGQTLMVFWLTGLSGAGKSTIAVELHRLLQAAGTAAFILDGDELRTGLNSDLGFSDADRKENIRRVGEVARLMSEAGLVVIVALISPFRADRDAVRARFAPGRFVEVFIDTPLEVAEQRDPKGLYRRARAGTIAAFTGISSPYEAPLQAEFVISTTRTSASAAAQQLLAAVTQSRAGN
jgi:adenylyl-sulfate kinase